MAGPGRNFSEQHYLRETKNNSRSPSPLSNSPRNPPVRQFPFSHLGAVLLSCHLATSFISFKGKRFNYEISNIERRQHLSASLDESLTSPLSSETSIKSTCGCNIESVLSSEWHKLSALLVMLTPVAHLLLYVSRFKELSLSVSSTTFSSTTNLLAYIPCTNSNKGYKIATLITDATQTSSVSGKRDQTSEDAPKEADKATGYLANETAAVRGRRRKKGKQGKGKSRPEQNDIEKSTPGTVKKIQDSIVKLSLGQLSKISKTGLSVCAEESLKSTSSSTICNSKENITYFCPISGSGRPERITMKGTSALRNMKTDKVGVASKSQLGHQRFVIHSKENPTKGSLNELTSRKPENECTKVQNTPDDKENFAVQNLQSNSSSKLTVPKYTPRSKHNWGSFNVPETLRKITATANSPLNDEPRPEYYAKPESYRVVPGSSKRTFHFSSQDLMSNSERDFPCTKSIIPVEVSSPAYHSSRAKCHSPPSLTFTENNTGKLQAYDTTWTAANKYTCGAAKTPNCCRAQECLYLVDHSPPNTSPAADVSTVTVTYDGAESKEKLESRTTISIVPDETSFVMNGGANGRNIREADATSNERETQKRRNYKKTTMTAREPMTSNHVSTDGNAELNQRSVKKIAVEEENKQLVKRADRKQKRGRRGRNGNKHREDGNGMADTRETDT